MVASGEDPFISELNRRVSLPDVMPLEMVVGLGWGL